MKRLLSVFILFSLDTIAISISIALAFEIRNLLDPFFTVIHTQELSQYLSFALLYVITLVLFTYEGVYTHRYDFWHESRLILKAVVFSFFIVLAYLALTKTIQQYSRSVIVLAFVFMALIIPLFKNIGKKTLFKFRLWHREAKIYGDDFFIKNEIFGNTYLGYIEAKKKEPKTVFINSRGTDIEKLRSIIEEEIQDKHEVVFIPLMNEYDFTQSQIYELSNTRTNLIVFQNRLKSRYRIWLKNASDILMFILLFPLILPILGLIALLIKKEEPNGSILFKQDNA